jgi:dihydrofolate reductase
MSLDGFVADPSDAVGPLFDWYANGEIDVAWPGNKMVTHTTAASTDYLHEIIDHAGALVVGRRLFDYTGGWNGSHPLGVPVFVVSYTVPAGWPRDDAPFTFVSDGVESAVAQARAAAGDKTLASPGRTSPSSA